MDIIRVPRPIGLTQMLNQYNKLSDENEKSTLLTKIRDHVIHIWTLNSGNICGKIYSLNDLSRFLGIDVAYIQIYLRDQVINSNIWKTEIQQDILEGLLGQQLSWVLEDRMDVQNQVDLLRASQGGKYTPFVSAELNKALKLKLETSTSLQSIIRSLTGGNTVNNNFFTQINNNSDNTEKGVTREEAIQIIESSQKSLSVDEKRSIPANFIEENYELDSLPVVCALDQEGVDTSKEGLTLNKQELNIVTDNYRGALEASNLDLEELSNEIEERYHHEHRRQLEIGEDLDGEDPEIDN